MLIQQEARGIREVVPQVRGPDGDGEENVVDRHDLVEVSVEVSALVHLWRAGLVRCVCAHVLYIHSGDGSCRVSLGKCECGMGQCG